MQKIAQLRAGEAPEPNPPRKAVVSITASGEGGSAEWLSKTAFGKNGWRKLLTGFMAVAKPLRTAIQAAGNVMEALDEPDDQDSNETVKKTSTITAVASEAAGVVGDLMTIWAILSAMSDLSVLEPEGLLIENSDSYAEIIAKGFGALASSDGPVIIESGADGMLIADELRRKIQNPADLKALDNTVKDVAQGKVPDCGFSGSSAVLLFGRLFRTVNEEACIMGRKSVAAISTKKIHIAAGGDAKPDPAAYPSAMFRASNRMSEPSFDRGFASGVCIEGLDSDSVIRLSAPIQNSSIELLQGMGRTTDLKTKDKSQARKLIIDKEGLLLRDKEGGWLKIQEETVSLAATQDSNIWLEKALASIERKSGQSVTIKTDGLTVEHDMLASVKGGGTEIKADSTGFNVSGAAAAKIDGKVIQLG
jgi:hypothetical protein